QNWGWCIHSKQDSNYIIVGWSFDEFTDATTTFIVEMAAPNDTIVNAIVAGGAHSTILGPGNPGEINHLRNGGFITPMIKQWPDPPYNVLSSAGVMKIAENGDTVFLRTYTDTSRF